MATLTQEKRTATAMQLNAMMDAADLAADLQSPFTIEDVKAFDELGIDLVDACIGFLHQPTAQENGFTKSLYERITKGQRLTEAQVVSGLNVMREGILGLRPSKTSPLVTPDDDRAYRCNIDGCGTLHHDRVAFIEHKMEVHGWKPGDYSVEKALVDPVSVLEVNEGKLGLDLSGLPSGNFAIFEGDEVNGRFRFFKVRRVKKAHRDRRYRYGKASQRVGTEIVPKGTIEVREVSGATERLAGYQRPGEKYLGQYEYELEEFLDSPKTYARFYAQEREVCMICGRKLTDEASRNDLMGPECFDKRFTHWQSSYWKEVSTKLRADGANRKPYEPVKDYRPEAPIKIEGD